jgi:putative ABC transport system permease protein
MIIKANLKEAIRSLYSSKQRTMLALIGIVIGIGSVIAMVSIGTIVQKEATSQFREMGTDIISIIKGSGGALKLQDAFAIPANCPAISIVAPFLTVSGGEVGFAGKNIASTAVLGVTESFLVANKLRMKSGRSISDLDEQSQFCTVGSKVYQELVRLGASEVIGQKLKVGNGIFTIIGVVDEVPEGGMRRFQPNESIYIHITTSLRMARGAEITNVIARVKPGFSNIAAGEQVKAFFTAKTAVKTVDIISPEEIIAQMEKQMRMFTLLLGAIGSISLIVGGVGVMNVMIVSVSERRKEIGIRRALGARRGDIKGQFLIESIILSLIGGFFGVIIGVGASWIISHFAKWQFAMSPSAILLGVGVSTAVGVFFGFYPARQASMLDPIVALRSN